MSEISAITRNRLLNRIEVRSLIAVAERDGSARSAGPRGSADAVNVCLGLVRQVVLAPASDEEKPAAKTKKSAKDSKKK